jgi:hypothetical protein
MPQDAGLADFPKTKLHKTTRLVQDESRGVYLEGKGKNSP